MGWGLRAKAQRTLECTATMGWGLRAKAQRALECTADTLTPKASSVFVAFHAIRRHKHALGFYPNVVRPHTFSEKIVYRLIFDRRPILVTLQDKYAAREYVRNRLGDHLLPRWYCVTKNPQEIPFDDLPDKFVVKATHGCKWVYLVPDKMRLDRDDLIAKSSAWLRRNYYWGGREWAYRHIEPRVIVEEFISDGTGLAPTDYKFYVFHGRVHFIWAMRGRFVDPQLAAYTPSWERVALKTQWKSIGTPVPHPPHLNEMIESAETLGDGLDFLRVDLYDAGKVYFGEMTVYPSGGGEFYDLKWNRYCGGLWNLSLCDESQANVSTRSVKTPAESGASETRPSEL